MSVREFTDEDGRAWRAWDIKPHEIHPATKSEDYLAECYVTGWIVFETITGGEKRRLCPWPMNWANESEDGLRRLLSAADVVPAHRVRTQRVSGDWEKQTVESAAEPGELDVTDLQVVRTFRYPNGRVWVVSVMPYDNAGSPVLRFSSGTRCIDLKKWRKDWADQPDADLIWMLRRASPRTKPGRHGPATPMRRWDDQTELNA